MRVPARASLWYIAISVVERGIALAATPIFTRLLSPAQYGLFPLYNTWLGIFGVIGTLEVSGGVTLSGLQRFGDRKNEFQTAVLGLLGTLFSIICIVVTLMRKPLGELTGLGGYAVLLPTEVLLLSAGSLYTQRLKYEYRYREAAAVGIGSALTAPLVSILLITTLGADSDRRIFGSLAAATVAAIPSFITILRGGDKLFSREVWGFLLGRALPLLPHYAAVSVIVRAPEIAIGRMLGTGELAKYSVCASLGFGASVITGGLGSALGPWVLRRIASGRTDEIPKLLHSVLRAVGVICLILLAFAPEGMAIIAPREYRTAIGAVYPIMLSAPAILLSSVVSQGLCYYGRSVISSLPAIAAAAVSVAFSMLTPYAGIVSAGIGIFASYTVLALLCSRVFRRVLGVSPIEPRPFLLTLTVFSLTALVLYFLRESPFARILLAAAISGAFLPEGIRLIGTVREKRGD